jgi:RNA polymerase sigma factor (sigma-70 family)
MEEKQLLDLFRKETPRMRYYFHEKLKGRIAKTKMSGVKNELVEKTSLKILEAVHKEKLNAGYSFGILVSLCEGDIWKDYVREMKKAENRPSVISLEEITEDPDSISFIGRYEASDIVQKLIQRMGAKDRELFQMQLDGLNLVEIAEAQHVSYGSVKMRASRLREWIRNCLG